MSKNDGKVQRVEESLRGVAGPRRRVRTDEKVQRVEECLRGVVEPRRRVRTDEKGQRVEELTQRNAWKSIYRLDSSTETTYKVLT
jgi:hypothetical protein